MEAFKQDDFDRVVHLESAIAKAILPYAANTPTRFAIFALGRVIKQLLSKCDAETRAIYVTALSDTFKNASPIVQAGPDLASLHKFFH